VRAAATGMPIVARTRNTRILAQRAMTTRRLRCEAAAPVKRNRISRMNTPASSLDERGVAGRYMKLVGPCSSRPARHSKIDRYQGPGGAHCRYAQDHTIGVSAGRTGHENIDGADVARAARRDGRALLDHQSQADEDRIAEARAGPCCIAPGMARRPASNGGASVLSIVRSA
jgi:hypothetical protein